MSRSASIELDWADGTYVFKLGWGQLVLLQEATNVGPYVSLQRLENGQWRLEDVSNVIRLGLIGGGMKPVDALNKVRVYVEDRPPLENVIFAHGILRAGLIGAPDEPVGDDKGGQSTTAIDDLPDGKIRFAAIYGTGAVLGFTPQQVNAMSMWEFMAAVDGYRKAHSPDDGKLSSAEVDDVWTWMQGKES